MSSTLPNEHVKAAMERLAVYIEEFSVEVKGVRRQFKPINRTKLLHFQTAAEQKQYDSKWQRHIEACQKIGKNTEYSRFLILVQLNKFAEEAEVLRAPYLARYAYEAWQEGKAPVVAVKFKTTVAKVMQILHNDYNVSRDNVSLIWGGHAGMSGQAGQQYTAEEMQIILTRAMQGDTSVTTKMIKDIHNQLLLAESGLADVEASLKLGKQSKKERQKEIDKFQSGKSHFCIFTLKSGGVGLSLHHTDELTKQKVRRKDNGWAFVEDIPSIPVRPRKLLGTPTYSAIELVQMLGRTARLTSLSDTEQDMYFFADTVEEHMSELVGNKLQCLGTLVEQKDDWTDLYHQAVSGKGVQHLITEVEKAKNFAEELQKHKKEQGIEKDDDILFGGGDSDLYNGEDEE
jgi:hypothetical protein